MAVFSETTYAKDWNGFEGMKEILSKMDHKKSPTAKILLDDLNRATRKSSDNEILCLSAIEIFRNTVDKIGSSEGYAIRKLKHLCDPKIKYPHSLTPEHFIGLTLDVMPLVANPIAKDALKLLVGEEEAKEDKKGKGKEAETGVDGASTVSEDEKKEGKGFGFGSTNSKTARKIVEIIREYYTGNISGDEAYTQIINAVQGALNNSILRGIIRIIAWPVLLVQGNFTSIFAVLGYAKWAESHVFGLGRAEGVNEFFKAISQFASQKQELQKIKNEKAEIEAKIRELGEIPASSTEEAGSEKNLPLTKEREAELKEEKSRLEAKLGATKAFLQNAEGGKAEGSGSSKDEDTTTPPLIAIDAVTETVTPETAKSEKADIEKRIEKINKELMAGAPAASSSKKTPAEEKAELEVKLREIQSKIDAIRPASENPAEEESVREDRLIDTVEDLKAIDWDELKIAVLNPNKLATSKESQAISELLKCFSDFSNGYSKRDPNNFANLGLENKRSSLISQYVGFKFPFFKGSAPAPEGSASTAPKK